MSSMWGFTKIVVEGEKAKDVYELLCRAKQECGREECGYCSEIIRAGKGQYRFAFGIDQVVKYEIEDNPIRKHRVRVCRLSVEGQRRYLWLRRNFASFSDRVPWKGI